MPSRCGALLRRHPGRGILSRGRLADPEPFRIAMREFSNDEIWIQPIGATQCHGLLRMPVGRGLVAPPAPLRPVRSCRVLRLFSRPARLASRQGVRAPGRPKLRARRRLVLGLRDRGVPRRPLARGAKASPAGSTNARTRRSRPSRLAGAPQLSKRSEGTRGEASLTQSRGLPSGPARQVPGPPLPVLDRVDPGPEPSASRSTAG